MDGVFHFKFLFRKQSSDLSGCTVKDFLDFAVHILTPFPMELHHIVFFGEKVFEIVEEVKVMIYEGWLGRRGEGFGTGRFLEFDGGRTCSEGG